MSAHTPTHEHQRAWWKEATIYQIYPASFKDSNSDGWGDIPGILSKIDYIASLGVDAIWLCPIFQSPQIDMGYDISDYNAIHEPYGKVKDVEELIAACHNHNIKIILDLVANHTSDQHAWFKESRSSKYNPKRDWYYWRPARYYEQGNKIPPTNYMSYFGGSAWEYDAQTDEYYLHLYDKTQPDLNWENEECRKAIYEVAMRFWLDKGIDGFRIDAANKLSKFLPFTDAPIIHPTSFLQPAPKIWCNGPRIHSFIKELNSSVLSHYTTYDGQEIATVGELSLCSDPPDAIPYTSAASKELNMVFQFDITHLGQSPNGYNNRYLFTPYHLHAIKKITEKWQVFIDGTDAWTTVFAENHDNGRSISRYANDAPEFREKSAKLLALWLIGQSGTLFLYQGQEIGMVNAPKHWAMSEYVSVDAKSYWAEALASDDPERIETVKYGLQIMARDHARLPMQWDGSRNAGFSEGEPWMRIHDDYAEINVEKQEKNGESVLAFYRKVLALRKEHKDVFVYGAFELVDEENEKTFVYRKRYGEKMALVVLNFTTEVQPVVETEGMRLLVSSYAESLFKNMLQPLEGRIYVNY